MSFKRLLDQKRRADQRRGLNQEIAYDGVLVAWVEHVKAARSAGGDPNPFYFPELSQVVIQRAAASMMLPDVVADLTAIRMYVYALLCRDPEDGWRKTRTLRATHKTIADTSADTWEASGKLARELIKQYQDERPHVLKFENVRTGTDPTFH